MATDKKPVTSYLSEDLEEQLIKYCESKGMVRDYKDGQTKPQLGTAIVKVLESFFGIGDEAVSSPLKETIDDLTHRLSLLESKESQGLSHVPSPDTTLESHGLSNVPSLDTPIESHGLSNVPSPESAMITSQNTLESNGLSHGLTPEDTLESHGLSTVPFPEDTLESKGLSAVVSAVEELRLEVDRLKHTERWSDQYFSDLQSQVYSLKSSLNSLESSIEPRLEQYLMDHPDQENGALWDSLDYMAERIDKLSITSDSTIEVIHDTSDMSRGMDNTNESTPSEIPLEATKDSVEDVSSESSLEAPDEPHKGESEDKEEESPTDMGVTGEMSIDTPTTEETPIDSDGEWKPLEELAEELGIESVANLKTNISKKFPEGGKYATHLLRKGKGKIEIKREVLESGRTKNGSMKGRLIKGVRN